MGCKLFLDYVSFWSSERNNIPWKVVLIRLAIRDRRSIPRARARVNLSQDIVKLLAKLNFSWILKIKLLLTTTYAVRTGEQISTLFCVCLKLWPRTQKLLHHQKCACTSLNNAACQTVSLSNNMQATDRPTGFTPCCMVHATGFMPPTVPHVFFLSKECSGQAANRAHATWLMYRSSYMTCHSWPQSTSS